MAPKVGIDPLAGKPVIVIAPRLFCFGLGYTAQALIPRLQARGFAVAGTVTDPARAGGLAMRGIDVHIMAKGAPLADAAAALAGTTHLLSSVPPGDDGDPVLLHHAPLLARLKDVIWAGYLSTTGVYGDREGDWVDETAAIAPGTSRGRRRAEAEAGWRAVGLPVHLFRLAGIYGPARNQIAQLRAGTARRIYKSGQVFSRIHVDDIVSALEASIARPRPGAAYNVCDDLPAPSWEVVEYAAALIGVPPPPLVPFEEAALSPMARSFFAESKRVSNRLIRDELALDLAYPSYREGLAALVGDTA